LLTTQYLDEADQLAARVVIVDAGRVIADGSPAELKSQAGTDRIEVHTRDAQSLPRAASVLSGLEGNAAETDSSTRRCSVPVGDGAGILPVAMTRLTEGGVAVEDITLRRPTLDEVFLALTGHAAEERGRRPSRRAPSGGPDLPESDSCLEFEQQGAWR
ncbi:MAG TPA: DUF4162 domain-containing protein, partial [Acidimicrobiales bacterium]|nr:DUF4162 domain-containing protein [Acidimicrobiales bacterium]